MTDHKIQQLRRAAASGDEEAEVAWFRERIRTDERGPLPCLKCKGSGLGPRPTCSEGAPLPLDRRPCRACEGTGLALFSDAARLAALCGSESARRTLDWDDFKWHVETPSTLGELAQRLSDWGRPATVRAAIATARTVLPEWLDSPSGITECYCVHHLSFEGDLDVEGDPDCGDCWGQGWRVDLRPGRAIKVAEACLVDPCEKNREAKTEFLRMAGLPSWAEATLGYAGLEEGAEEAAGLVGTEAVRGAISEALIKWALR